jgi:transposase
MSVMPKIPPYTLEFRLEAVRLLRSSGRSVPQLAKELGVSPQTLRNWSTQLDIDEGKAEGLSSSEREELRRLRREVKVLTEEREILKKAAAFFAKESGTR